MIILPKIIFTLYYETSGCAHSIYVLCIQKSRKLQEIAQNHPFDKKINSLKPHSSQEQPTKMEKPMNSKVIEILSFRPNNLTTLSNIFVFNNYI